MSRLPGKIYTTTHTLDTSYGEGHWTLEVLTYYIFRCPPEPHPICWVHGSVPELDVYSSGKGTLSLGRLFMVIALT